MLTHEQRVAVIQGGGSVHFNGQIFDSLAALPGEAHFVADDADRKAMAKAALETKILALEQELARVNATAGSSPPAPKAPDAKPKG